MDEQGTRKDVINVKFPVRRLGVLGFQHVLVMYSVAVIVPLILWCAVVLSACDIGFLTSADLLTFAIATVIQVVCFGKFIGIQLSILMGAAIITLPAMIMIAGKDGLPTMYGSIL